MAVPVRLVLAGAKAAAVATVAAKIASFIVNGFLFFLTKCEENVTMSSTRIHVMFKSFKKYRVKIPCVKTFKKAAQG